MTHDIARDFTQFGLPENLMQCLNRMQFKTPTPIQAQAIPLALAGRDILGSAQTGTGKTGAFGIPMIAKLLEDDFSGGLVLTPTRELAQQVLDSLRQMIPSRDIPTALLIGGESMPKQFKQLQAKPRLIVGTPGRINDHLKRGTLKLNHIRFLVLDETDRMLDMGFGVQLEAIAKFLPETRQTMMFSATLPREIVRLSGAYLNNPERIAVGSTTAPVSKITQTLIKTNEAQKYDVLTEQLATRQGSVIIFVKTKWGADKLADKLCDADHQADALHGDLKQNRRDRVIANFRNGKFKILVATDVAARGLDIPHIEHVINYDLPQCPEDYIHRIGRTARAGAEGEAVNLLTPSDNAKWRAIQRLIAPDEKPERAARNDNDGGQKRNYGPKKPFRPGGGGKPFGQKSTRPWERNDRQDSRPAFREDRPERAERKDHADRSARFERDARPARPFARDDRPYNNDRPQRRPEGETFPGYSNDKPKAKKPFGSQGQNRQDGPKKPFWADKKPRSNDGGKPSFGGKPAFGGGFKKKFSAGGGKPHRPRFED